MKKLALSLFFIALATTIFAQGEEPYEFKEIKHLPATPVKSQDRTGTCWAFSSASFLESEALRMGKGETNLSEMFVVRHIYRQKIENYVRRQGTTRFSEGGLAHDLLNAVQAFGVIPESVYPGRKDPNKPYDHSQLEKDLKTMCDGFVELGKAGKLPLDWLSKVDSALDEEFGPVPTTFTVDGTVFTPTSYRDYLGIKPDDYVTVTSYTHHPFYSTFILEVPDNWSNGTFYNLPINELMRCLNHSLEQGYTVEWDADVSNMGFSAGNGLAIVPEKDWKDRSVADRKNAFKTWEPEMPVSQEYRQQMFDSQVTTDDHLMHIVGMLDEAHSGDYYEVKNSWGEISDLKGFVRVSENYMRLNTISFTVHKSALPADIVQRLGIPGPAMRGPVMRSGSTQSTKNLRKQPTDLKVSPARIQPRIEKVQPNAPAEKSDN
ncbi:MAG: aminopeptidase [Lewinellaceae bacterium]|nr:aminopeptidase [Saprospiraceae bacterium]MCB9355125.1 aminopeptidase [Lewinellaceae bacterium]